MQPSTMQRTHVKRSARMRACLTCDCVHGGTYKCTFQVSVWCRAEQTEPHGCREGMCVKEYKKETKKKWNLDGVWLPAGRRVAGWGERKGGWVKGVCVRSVMECGGPSLCLLNCSPLSLPLTPLSLFLAHYPLCQQTFPWAAVKRTVLSPSDRHSQPELCPALLILINTHTASHTHTHTLSSELLWWTGPWAAVSSADSHLQMTHLTLWRKRAKDIIFFHYILSEIGKCERCFTQSEKNVI